MSKLIKRLLMATALVLFVMMVFQTFSAEAIFIALLMLPILASGFSLFKKIG